MAYQYAGKKFTDVCCLVCKMVHPKQMIAVYLDITNEGFHCREHRALFHQAVSFTWACCDNLDP